MDLDTPPPGVGIGLALPNHTYGGAMLSGLNVHAEPMEGFRPPASMTPEELGDTLARLVWESFSDFLDEGDTGVSLQALGVRTDDGMPSGHAAEEALIFLLWAHTRGAQLAFVGRASDELLRSGLDSLHRAVFEDMEGHGTPAAQLPLFEQRVGARYAEYNQAASSSDAELSRVALRHLLGSSGSSEQALAVLDRALAVANPLRDFLEDVKLVSA